MTTEATYSQYAIEEYVVTTGAVLRAGEGRDRALRVRVRGEDPGAAQGPDRLRQDALRRVHGVQARPPDQRHRARPRATATAEETGRPLVTVACHEDLTASDLVGRYLLEGDSTRWIDGPLTRAVKAGAICYLDEIVEARKDTTVLIHPLTDHRRLLPIEKLGQIVEARDGFLLVISYNPGYQSALKDLKHSTRQRFMSIEFGYPPRDLEAKIIAPRGRRRTTRSPMDLAKLGEKVRHLKEHGLAEGVSTRLLIYAGKLIHQGIAPRRACQVAVDLGAHRRPRRPAEHRRGGVVDLRVGDRRPRASCSARRERRLRSAAGRSDLELQGAPAHELMTTNARSIYSHYDKQLTPFSTSLVAEFRKAADAVGDTAVRRRAARSGPRRASTWPSSRGAPGRPRASTTA